MKLVQYLFIFCFVIACTNANAGFIVNGNSVNTLTLGDNPVDFYDYTNGSSNTGLEVSDVLTFFIAEYSGSFHLIGLFDDADGAANKGTANMFMADDSGFLGAFNFVDDGGPNGDYFWQNAAGTRTVFNAAWAIGFSDGFVYELGGTTGTNITLNFSNLLNVSSLQFLNFDGGSQTLGNKFNISYVSDNDSSVEVNEPASLLFISMFVIGLVASRKKI